MKKDNAVEPASDPGFSSSGTTPIILSEYLFTRADFPSMHSATLLELENGELLCAFFGGTEESAPDVEIWLCRKPSGGSWTKPISVADGRQADGTRYSTGNPVLFQPKGGNILLFYKVFKPDEPWWGEFKISADNCRTWSKARKLPIAEGIIGPVKNKPIQLEDGSIISGSSFEDPDGWRVHVERSTDGGMTWTRIGPVNDVHQFNVIQPAILTHRNGRIQMLMRNKSEHSSTRIPETWSDDGGLTWTPLANTILPNNNSGIDAVTLQDNRHLLVYNHSTRKQDTMGHKGRGVLNVAVSEDGRNWEAALVLDYINAINKQYSYPAVIRSRDGLVHMCYTWHRKRIKHVVLNPDKLVTYPIVNGKWPVEYIPLIPGWSPGIKT